MATPELGNFILVNGSVTRFYKKEKELEQIDIVNKTSNDPSIALLPIDTSLYHLPFTDDLDDKFHSCLYTIKTPIILTQNDPIKEGYTHIIKTSLLSNKYITPLSSAETNLKKDTIPLRKSNIESHSFTILSNGIINRKL